MTAQNYGPVPSDSINPEPTNTDLSASAVATIILSTLALTGILGVLVILMVKLSSGFMQRSNENQPLLNDRYSKYCSASIEVKYGSFFQQSWKPIYSDLEEKEQYSYILDYSYNNIISCSFMLCSKNF